MWCTKTQARSSKAIWKSLQVFSKQTRSSQCCAGGSWSLSEECVPHQHRRGQRFSREQNKLVTETTSGQCKCSAFTNMEAGDWSVSQNKKPLATSKLSNEVAWRKKQCTETFHPGIETRDVKKQQTFAAWVSLWVANRSIPIGDHM